MIKVILIILKSYNPQAHPCLRRCIRITENTIPRWYIKQDKRSKKIIGIGYQSGAYSKATSVTLKVNENCIMCGGSEES